MEDEFIVREKKILSLLEHEIADGEEMTTAVRHNAELLLAEKGYAPDDMQKGVRFDVILGQEHARAQMDFVVLIEGRAAMVIKCAAGSLSSRERHVVAAARVFGSSPVPIAVVMDPMDAVVLDGMSGRVVGEGYGAIPTRDQLRSMIAEREYKPLAPEKLEREKRVLLAFDAIQCCVPKGADGKGVHI